MDFISVSSDLVFGADLRPQCVTVTIVDDQIPEPEETFTLQLTSSSLLRAVIVQPITIITITDADSMFCSAIIMIPTTEHLQSVHHANLCDLF